MGTKGDRVSGIDSKATPSDYVIGDLTHSSEKPGPWCSTHAYYDCPVCRGEEEAWVFPTEIAISPIDSWVGSGPSDTPPSEGAGLRPVPQVTAAAGLGADVPAAPTQVGGRPLRRSPSDTHAPITTNPGLLARLRLMFGESQDGA
jgi:hypothetical protein